MGEVSAIAEIPIEYLLRLSCHSPFPQSTSTQIFVLSIIYQSTSRTLEADATWSSNLPNSLECSTLDQINY